MVPKDCTDRARPLCGGTVSLNGPPTIASPLVNTCACAVFWWSGTVPRVRVFMQRCLALGLSLCVAEQRCLALGLSLCVALELVCLEHPGEAKIRSLHVPLVRLFLCHSAALYVEGALPICLGHVKATSGGPVEDLLDRRWLIFLRAGEVECPDVTRRRRRGRRNRTSRTARWRSKTRQTCPRQTRQDPLCSPATLPG
jgi:hypothetical protein